MARPKPKLPEPVVEQEVVYKATPILSQFHQSRKFYRLVLGPVGSGKSTGCCFETLAKGNEQPRWVDGIRRSRFVVVRNTYRELKDTTLQTWLQWFPETHFGKFHMSDMIHPVDLGDSKIEVLFRALDTVEDIKKLLSLDITGAWINEVREVPKGIIDALAERCGRYHPPGIKASWKGIFMDSNMPDEDHWIYDIAERRIHELKEWDIFKQPGGLIEMDGKFTPNPLAENTANLPDNYYLQGIETADPDHVRVMRCAQYGYVREGKPVIHEYSDQVHCSKELLRPLPLLPIRIGLDFGLTPAAVFGQLLPDGRWIWFDEIVSEDMGMLTFARLLINKMQSYPGYKYTPIIGDPAGNVRMQTDEQTVFQVLNAQLANARLPIHAHGAPTNDFLLRREAIAKACQRMIDGKPGFLISPNLAVARKGLRGGYCFKRLKVTGDEKYHEVPDKNKFSHVVEAGGYMMLGAGEGISLITAEQKQMPLELPMMGCA